MRASRPPEGPASRADGLDEEDRAKLEDLAKILSGPPEPPPAAESMPAEPPEPVEVVIDAAYQEVTEPAAAADPPAADPPAAYPPAASPAAAPPALPAPPAPPPPPSAQPSESTENTPMVPWITTKQMTIDLFPSWTKNEGDKDWSLGAVTVDVAEISAKLDALIASLNEDQWEIKMVVPLDKSLTYHEHQRVVRAGTRREPEALLGAFGLGWAAGTTSSLLILCQRTEWLDQAEYRSRMAERRARLEAEERRRERAAALEHNVAINAKITAAQKILDGLKTGGVEIRKSGFLRGEKFVVGGVEYTNRTEAESALRARIGEIEADLAALPRQLKPVPPEA